MIKYVGKAIRVDKGISVRGLAKLAQVAPSTVYKWECGDHLPDLVSLDLVSNALSTTPWKLIEFIKDK